MPLQAKMSPLALGWLGKAFDSVSKLSPFAAIDGKGFGQEDKDELVKQGVIDETGEVTAKWAVALQALADCDGYGRVKLRFGPMQSQKIVYFCGDDPVVALTVTSSGVVVEHGMDVGEFVNDVLNFTGISMLVRSDVKVELDYVQSLVLGACVDINRRAVLKAIAEERLVEFVAVSLDDVAADIEGREDKPQRLTNILGLMKRSRTVDRGDMDAGFAGLVEKGVLEKSDRGYELSAQMKLLAGNLLIFDQIVHCDLGVVAGNKVELAECLFVQSGLHDILMIDPGGGTVTLETVTGIMVAEYLRSLLAKRPVLSNE